MENRRVLKDGFVRLIDLMGDDKAVVNAARISYGEGTKTVSEDRQLIRYLLRNGHTSPLEMCEMKFHIRLPIDVMRQLVRHRTANINEYSTRYSLAIDAYNETYPNEWRSQSTNNKQGSGNYIDENKGKIFSNTEQSVIMQAKNGYNRLIRFGVAKEQARKILPLCTYTEIIWKMDLRNLLHFLKLRLDAHAQYEIRQYAIAIAEIVKMFYPVTYEAFEDYTLEAVTFSKQEMKIINSIIDRNAIDSHYFDEMSKGEIADFKKKLHIPEEE